MNATVSRSRQRGVSLIEALVAFGLMAFGMLAVVGMQATLHGSGDLARQRAEAVRIAQDAIEEWRGFSTLATTPNRTAYGDIVTAVDTNVTGANATYTVKRRVPANPVVGGTVTPERRTLVVDVEWQDRTGQTQSVRLSSAVAGIEPTLPATLMLAANPDPLVAPRGRFRGIPASAVPLGGGRSGYVPPGQTSPGDRVAWVFNNLTGLVTLCTTSGTTTADLLLTASAPQCSGGDRAVLLSGTVRFATALVAPSDATVANPGGPIYPAFGLTVIQTSPTAQTVTCFQDPLASAQVTYACAVPVTAIVSNWSGRIAFTPPLPIAASATTSASTSEYKVCRYFAAASYTSQATALLNQNFVIIRAGDGTTPYQCPTSGSPRTWAHQP